jgi:DNA replication protein DnaC
MIDFKRAAEQMLAHGMKLPEQGVQISIPEGKELIQAGIEFFTGKREIQWLPEYDHVAAWLENNDHRGIFMYGDCGRGKSLLARYVLPAILLNSCNKVVSVFDMIEINSRLDEALTKKILTLDDVGVEDVSVKFGERRMAFAWTELQWTA